MKKFVAATGLVVLMLGTAGCFGSKDPGTVAASCSFTYQLDGAPELLGSAASFKDSAADALAAGQSTSLATIAATAGWQGAWDRMVIVKKGMPADYLSRVAQTPDLCWSGIPDIDDRWASGGYYVFMRGAEPVQSVKWVSPTEAYFGYTGEPVVGADVVLQSDSSGGVRMDPQQ
ncbi:MAG: hypothetical protein GX610_02060 [Rhodococcus sp.]|nr:hypothetical protein [Rhodococcus sp. (in: high G+C Gram-positive bacteria)]